MMYCHNTFIDFRGNGLKVTLGYEYTPAEKAGASHPPVQEGVDLIEIRIDPAECLSKPHIRRLEQEILESIHAMACEDRKAA